MTSEQTKVSPLRGRKRVPSGQAADGKLVISLPKDLALLVMAAAKADYSNPSSYVRRLVAQHFRSGA